MAIVRTILADYPDAKLYTVDLNGTVLDALQEMKKADTGAVLVSDGKKIVGIFTERDYSRNVEVNGREAKNTPIKELMTKEMVMVKPDTSVQQCINLMTRYHMRHLPVIENDKVIGMVSLRRLADALMADQKETIIELENYIMGTGFAQ